MRVDSLDSPIPVEWILPETVDVPPAFRVACGGHPVVADIAWRRGLRSVEEVQAFLDPAAYRPTRAAELPNIGAACSAIERAISLQQSILVWGDFDADGQSATSVLVSGLRMMGANVSYYVPDRARESHGLNMPGMYRAKADGVSLLLTCDCGVSNAEEIRWFCEQGGTVVVTDHHEVPAELPPADAVVDNKLLPESHPLRDLAGVGVAYKLIEALMERADRAGEAEQLLDLVALGIVADVVPQHQDNRYLLQLGLERMMRTERPGLRALLSIATGGRSITAETIGFGLGPRLNAAGRLADASAAVRLLLTEDEAEAEMLAQQLDDVNKERRELTARIAEEAILQVDALPGLDHHACLVLSSSTWHPGVVGIVANQIAERYARPTVMLVPTEEGNSLRGSARSFAGVNLYEAILTQRHLLNTFGGHAFAAGMSLSADNLEAFREGLNAEIAKVHDPSQTAKIIKVDAALNMQDITPGLAQELARLGPFGAGNPSPNLLVRNLIVTHRRELGADKNHLRLTVEDSEGVSAQLTWWRHGQAVKAPLVSAVMAIGVGLEGEDLAVEVTAVDIAREAPSASRQSPRDLDVIDLRLSTPWAEEGVRIDSWPVGEIAARGQTVVIRAVPLSISEMRDALRNLQPDRVVIDPVAEFDVSPSELLNRCAARHREDFRDPAATYDPSEVAQEIGATDDIAQCALRVIAKRLGRALNTSDGEIAPTADPERALAHAVGERRAFTNWFRAATIEDLLGALGSKSDRGIRTA